MVEAAAEGLRQSGFVNYFGLQRFGSGAVATHRYGQTDYLCKCLKQRREAALPAARFPLPAAANSEAKQCSWHTQRSGLLLSGPPSAQLLGPPVRVHCTPPTHTLLCTTNGWTCPSTLA